MISTDKYRPIIAAVLLALYAFIVTPATLWHHHNNTGAKYGSFPVDFKQDVFSKPSDAGSENGCEICSHKYSTYNDGDLIFFESSVLVKAAKNGFYYLSAVKTPSLSFFNKGPPSHS